MCSVLGLTAAQLRSMPMLTQLVKERSLVKSIHRVEIASCKVLHTPTQICLIVIIILYDQFN